jgi:FkbM family methyltransferase
MNLLEMRKAIGATRPVRAFTDWQPIAHLIAAITCSCPFNERVRFVANEITGRHGTRRYVLRDNGVAVHVRHHPSDIGIVEEVFIDRVYEPPARVTRSLDSLGRPLRILDLGANIGLFAVFALARWPQASVVAFEPDPQNLEVLNLTIGEADTDSRWRLEEAAATNFAGEVSFAVGRYAESAIVDKLPSPGSNVRRVRAVDAFDSLGEADLAKLDIEGGEWAILGDPRLAQIPTRVLVLEYHPQRSPGPDPCGAAREALLSAGYRTLDVPLKGAREGQGMMWAWREGT